MYTPDDIIYTSRFDEHEEKSHADYYTLYGSIITPSGEPAIVSHAWYSVRADVRKAALHVLSSISGRHDDRIDKTMKIGESNLYDRSIALLGDPAQYKGIGALTLTQVVDIIGPDANELSIIVSRKALEPLRTYYHRVGEGLKSKSKIISSWERNIAPDSANPAIVYTLR